MKCNWVYFTLTRPLFFPQMTVLVVGLTLGIQWTFLLIVVEDVAVEWDPNFQYIKLLQGLLVGSDCFLGDVPFLYISCKYHLEVIQSYAIFT